MAKKKARRGLRVDGKPARRTVVNARDKKRMQKWFGMRRKLEGAMRELRGRIDEVIRDYTRKGEQLQHYDIDTGEMVYVQIPKPAKKARPEKDEKPKETKGGK